MATTETDAAGLTQRGVTSFLEKQCRRGEQRQLDFEVDHLIAFEAPPETCRLIACLVRSASSARRRGTKAA